VRNEIIGLLGDDLGPLLDLLERKVSGMLLAAEERELSHTLRVLILHPAEPTWAVVYAELASNPPMLLLVACGLVGGEVPVEVRNEAIDRFKRWTGSVTG
jgi:hypothetical protein